MVASIKPASLHSLLGKKVSAKRFQVGLDLKKVQNQGRDERTQEAYRIHLQKYTADVG